MWLGLMGGEGRGREGKGGTEALSVTSPNSLLQCITRMVWQGNTHKHTHIPLHTLPQDSLVATGTYKALCGIIHEAQLEALLVLKGLCQGVTQVVRGQGTLPTVLELGENALKKRGRTCLHMDYGTFCLTKEFVSPFLLNTQVGYVTQQVATPTVTNRK